MNAIVELLLSLILALTGIPRAHDATLQAIAEQRAREIVVDFSHQGLQTHEILAWNSGFSPEAGAGQAVQRWNASPSHAVIMFDPTLDRIGCAWVQGPSPDGSGAVADFYVCTFAASAGDEVLLPDPAPPYVQGLEPAPGGEWAPQPALVLPDTAYSP